MASMSKHRETNVYKHTQGSILLHILGSDNTEYMCIGLFM